MLYNNYTKEKTEKMGYEILEKERLQCNKGKKKFY
jgi:hypothetical protein